MKQRSDRFGRCRYVPSNNFISFVLHQEYRQNTAVPRGLCRIVHHGAMAAQWQRQGDTRNSNARGSSNHGTKRYSSSRMLSTEIDRLSSSLGSLSLQRSNFPPPTVQNDSRVISAPSGSEIEDYIQGILRNIIPPANELQAKKALCSHLESVLRTVLPNAQLKMMGGVANSFGLKYSDVDLCLVDPEFSSWKASQVQSALIRAGNC